MAGPTELVAELRTLIEVVRTADFDVAERSGVSVAQLCDQLCEVTAALEPHVVDDVRMQASLRSSAMAGGVPGQLPDLSGVTPREFFPYSPVIGELNPIAPPFLLWRDGDEVRGTGRFGSAFNGPPGGAHGGHVAAVIDELLGVTGVMSGNHGFTGTLEIRYESLTPLNTDLDLRGWVRGTEGRKTYICGEIRAGGRLCASAAGIFVRPAEPPA